jgi:hypothetical protein
MIREIIDALAHHSRVFQAIGGLTAASLGIAKVAWPAIEDRYSPPVATVHFMVVDPGKIGTTGTARAYLRKHRACYIIASRLEITDYAGRVHNVENTFNRVTIPQDRDVLRPFQWTIPHDMAGGPTAGGLYELSYGNCTDGRDPKTTIIGTFGRIGIEEAAK